MSIVKYRTFGNKRWQAHITSAGVMLEDTKEGYTEWPIMYDDGSMAYDRPERIPAYAKELARQAWTEYRLKDKLLFDLANALTNHHTGLVTMTPFAQTYALDKALLQRAIVALNERQPRLARALRSTLDSFWT